MKQKTFYGEVFVRITSLLTSLTSLGLFEAQTKKREREWGSENNNTKIIGRKLRMIYYDVGFRSFLVNRLL